MEKLMKVFFTICAALSLAAVLLIFFYLLVNGLPAVFKIGWKSFFGDIHWQPTGKPPAYGILAMVLTTIIGTFLALVISVPIGILTAVYLAVFAKGKTAGVIETAIQLLAGIPSVVYGLFGAVFLLPQVAKIELLLYEDSASHVFTGGANLLCAIVVLGVMILPIVVTVAAQALQSLPVDYREGSAALGATKMETVLYLLLPAARSGIGTAIGLGVERAMGEAMAVMMVAGNVVNLPGLFTSVRFLTTGMLSEMAYATGLHRSALFAIGLVLLCFLLGLQIFLSGSVHKGGRGKKNGKSL